MIFYIVLMLLIRFTKIVTGDPLFDVMKFLIIAELCIEISSPFVIPMLRAFNNLPG